MTDKDRYDNLCNIGDEYFNYLVNNLSAYFKHMPTFKFRYKHNKKIAKNLQIVDAYGQWHIVDALRYSIYYGDIKLDWYDISSRLDSKELSKENHATYLMIKLCEKNIIKLKCGLVKK